MIKRIILQIKSVFLLELYKDVQEPYLMISFETLYILSNLLEKKICIIFTFPHLFQQR